MDNYERSNQGPGGIATLPPTIGSPARSYMPAYPTQPAIPQYPMYSAMPAFPARKGVLQGLAGLLGLGTDDGTSIWSQPWFPYAALGALGVGIFLLMRSKSREGIPTDVLFRNPSRSAPPAESPQVLRSMYNMMVRSAHDHDMSRKSVRWSQGSGTENIWMIGDANGDRGDIVLKPKGDHWQAYHRTGHGDRKLEAREATDLAHDFFGHTDN